MDVQPSLEEEADESLVLKGERQSHFLGRSKKLQQQREQEVLRRRFTHQASRLGQAQNVEEEPARRWQGIFLSVALIACVFIGSVAWRYSDRWLFPIKHIELKGEFAKVDPLALQGVLSHYAAGSLLFFSASELQERLQDLPWVDQVMIHRHWPTTLEVVLTQKQPAIRFGDNQLLSVKGDLFSVPTMTGVENLPIIVGPDNRAFQLWQTFNQMNGILAPYHLSLWRLEVSPRMAYILVLNNGVTLYLGSTNVLERLGVFAKVYEKNLKAKSAQLQYADLRYTSGMAVGWKTGGDKG
jgi:cell division protein FtsQ